MDSSTIQIGPSNSYFLSNADGEFGGQSTWGYGVLDGDFRDIALVGVHLQNAAAACICDPLFEDRVGPPLLGADQRAVIDLLERRVQGKGGMHEAEIE